MSRGWQAVAMLGLSQIIGYGTVYYCFGILADDICAELGWSKSFYFGTLSAGLVAGGLMASVIGKAFDRYGAARVMAIGSIVSCLALLALSQSSTAFTFALSMIAVQFAGDLMLYDAAFTTLVQLSPKRGARRITYLTLIAGFASTIFWPITSWLTAQVGWRETLIIFAALNLFVCFPIHRLVSRWASCADKKTERTALLVKGSLLASQHRMAMVLMSAGFMLSSIALSAVLAMMVLLFQNMGFGAHSLLVGMLFGPAQVLVRFVHMIAGENHHPLRTTIFALGLLPLGLLMGLLFEPHLVAAVIMVVLIGLCSGLKSIVQGALPLHFFGSEGYGARLGFISSFRLVASAISPFGFTLVSERFSTHIAVSCLIAIGLLGVACFVVLGLSLSRCDARPTTEPYAEADQ
jgi:hypothetical protein